MKHPHVRGFTLIEMLIAMVIAAALAAIAIPAYQQYRERLMVNQAKMTIAVLAADLTRYYSEHNTYPATLAGLGIAIPLDPWGRPYVYVPINIVPAPIVGKLYKDKSLHPLNSDFDLYSLGQDGKTSKQIPNTTCNSNGTNNPPSCDDVIRTGDGSYIGLASGY